MFIMCEQKLKKLFYLGNFFVIILLLKRILKSNIRCPLNLLYCSNCSLIQLSHIAPQELMYRFYYKSGVTKRERWFKRPLISS